MALRYCLIVAVALTGCNRDPKPPRSKRVTPRDRRTPLSQRFSKEQAFAYVLPQLKPVKGVGSVRASDCGECHEAIYKEWKESTHAAALRDLQFQAELFKKSSPVWLCLNCHIPLQNQRRHFVRGLRGGDVLRPVQEPNPGFDRALQQEAITCAVCHVRRDSKGRSVVVGTRGNVKAPHPVRADRGALRRMCLRCHDPRGERITPLLVCWFRTQKEWKDGPHAAKRDCVDCHMPAVKRRLAAAETEFPVRTTHKHHWVGGGVPKEFSAYDRLLKRGYRSGLDVRLTQWRLTRAQQRVAFSLEVTNARAGHWVPTADPERHILLQAVLVDAQGKRLGKKTSRIGQVWKWAPRARKVSDNRLRPGSPRVWSTSLPLPASGAGAGAGAGVKLVLTAYHVRLSSKNARYMKKEPVRDLYVKGARALVKQIERHYPMATVVYREEVELATSTRRLSTPAELLRLSKQEQRIPLGARDY